LKRRGGKGIKVDRYVDVLEAIPYRKRAVQIGKNNISMTFKATFKSAYDAFPFIWNYVEISFIHSDNMLASLS
jgi:hypothetical protein